MNVTIDQVKEFWNANPCGSKLSHCKDRISYFNEIEAKRYKTEWHIPIVAKFDQYKNKDVLEIGCGIGTDGLQFAKNGANYTGVDLSPQAVKIAKERFSLFGVGGRIEVANAEDLPFEDDSFDHIYSFGVIHHSPHTERIIEEIHRVLRPGGTICIMVYNKSSINYYIEIMFLRKIFRWLLIPKFAPPLISLITGLDQTKLSDHRNIMLRRKNMTKSEWISINTDGPDCPLAKV
ncbi:MAG: class I SAM-dependent methyltransferase, partial [Candidatus Zixiibacteriota bacterium]